MPERALGVPEGDPRARTHLPRPRDRTDAAAGHRASPTSMPGPSRRHRSGAGRPSSERRTADAPVHRDPAARGAEREPTRGSARPRAAEEGSPSTAPPSSARRTRGKPCTRGNTRPHATRVRHERRHHPDRPGRRRAEAPAARGTAAPSRRRRHRDADALLSARLRDETLFRCPALAPCRETFADPGAPRCTHPQPRFTCLEYTLVAPRSVHMSQVNSSYGSSRAREREEGAGGGARSGCARAGCARGGGARSG